MVEPKRGALSAAGRSVKEMNERGAVQLLCNRAWRNMAATRLKNQTSARPRCLCCALRAHIQETECAERVFCGTRCQSHLRGVQQFFRLGMKRGAAALEDEAPQIFAWPEIFPDDVLCVLLLWRTAASCARWPSSTSCGRCGAWAGRGTLARRANSSV